MTGTRTRTYAMAVLEVKVVEPSHFIERCMKALQANGTISGYDRQSTAVTRVVYDVVFDGSAVRIVFIRTDEADPFVSTKWFAEFVAKALLGHPARKPTKKFRVEDGRLIRWTE